MKIELDFKEYDEFVNQLKTFDPAEINEAEIKGCEVAIYQDYLNYLKSQLAEKYQNIEKCIEYIQENIKEINTIFDKADQYRWSKAGQIEKVIADKKGVDENTVCILPLSAPYTLSMNDFI